MTFIGRSSDAGTRIRRGTKDSLTASTVNGRESPIPRVGPCPTALLLLSVSLILSPSIRYEAQREIEFEYPVNARTIWRFRACFPGRSPYRGDCTCTDAYADQRIHWIYCNTKPSEILDRQRQDFDCLHEYRLLHRKSSHEGKVKVGFKCSRSWSQSDHLQAHGH